VTLRSTVVAAAFVLVLGTIALAPRLTDAALTVAHNDRVHYVTHLVAGQAFSLCPCTQALAQTQITKGLYHARTPRQVKLLTTSPRHVVRAAVRRLVG
jgi:hypothetical protein